MKWLSDVRTLSFEPPLGQSLRMSNSTASPYPSILHGLMLFIFVTRLPVRRSCQTQLTPQLMPLRERSAVHTIAVIMPQY
jgi:hypothetical protein